MKLRIRALLVLALCFACAPASAFFQLIDGARAPADADHRPGHLLPSEAQLRQVKSLGAKAQWNRFGTIHTLIRHGGFLTQGLSGTPTQAARQWLHQNRALFKLSQAGVDDLEVINEGVTPYNEARAVLFRQRFGGLHVTRDGLITVGVVRGSVYYVSSSSAGDQPPAGGVALAPMQAWLKAAADVNRYVSDQDILSLRDLTARNGWHMIRAAGFSEPQRVRLVAVPIPAGGVRQAYETIVLDNQPGSVMAYVHLIDAETGAVLIRENHLYNAVQASAPVPFTGSLLEGSACSPRHSFEVGSGNASINVTTAAVNPGNGYGLSLYFTGTDGLSRLVANNRNSSFNVDTLTYAPVGGVAEGTYEVELCSEDNLTQLPPYNYVGNFIASEADFSGATPVTGASANAPQWRWFPSNPRQDYDSEDIRKITCFAALPTPGFGGCDIDSSNVAARAPWDTLFGGLIPTFTTIGNAAITAGDSLSPLTPSIPVFSLSPNRRYDFPFTNAWYSSKCSPAGIVTSQVPNSNGNDLSAITVNLFTTHNRFHDYSYHLGFTERNYNMQLYNFGLTPVTQQNDPEIGQAQAGALGGHPASPAFGSAPGRDNANQISLMDGVPGITNQYLFQPVGGVIYSPCTDGSLDTGIVGHEYTHAISNRMTGGPDGSLLGAQSGAMGESWSDLNATEYELASGVLPAEGYNPTALAGYTLGHQERGIRNYPLDTNPLNYGNMGWDTPGPQVHADGEIWNGTQWELRQAFINQYEAQFPYGDRRLQQACIEGKNAPEACPGNRRWIQLVYDAWLLLPSSITMLDARDAMLAADVARTGGVNQELMWRVFAHRGMGEFAYAADTEDVTPIPSFESPLADDEANVTFKVLAGDENNAPITSARILVGRHATRTRQIADTDPATLYEEIDDVILRQTRTSRDVASLVPATYDFIVTAPGYGIHSFTQELKSGDSTLTFTLPTNWASTAKGASATSSASGETGDQAGDLVNPAPPSSDPALLIDDSEDTGAIIGDNGVVIGSFVTIALAGGARNIAAAHISTAAGPANPGRWGALRSFELRTCTGACSDAQADFENVAYVSAPDAFPAGVPRPLQPDLNLRLFTFEPVSATHVQLRVLATQCSGGPVYQGDSDSDPLNNPDCMTSQGLVTPTAAVLGGPIINPDPGSYARATDIQLFSSAPVVSAKGKSLLPDSAVTRGRFGGALGGLLLLPLFTLSLLRRRYS